MMLNNTYQMPQTNYSLFQHPAFQPQANSQYQYNIGSPQQMQSPIHTPTSMPQPTFNVGVPQTQQQGTTQYAPSSYTPPAYSPQSMPTYTPPGSIGAPGAQTAQPMMHPQTMPSAQSGQIATPHPGATAASIGLNTMGTPQAYPTPVTMPTHQGSQAFQQLTPQQQAAQIGLNINGQPSTGMNALGNLNSVPQGNAGNYVAGLSGPTSFTVNV